MAFMSRKCTRNVTSTSSGIYQSSMTAGARWTDYVWWHRYRLLMGDMYTPIIKAGTHLATAKDGAALGALLDNATNQVVGQAKWIKVAQQSGNGKYGLVLGLGIAGGVLGTIAVYENRDRIKSWWRDKAAPRLLAGALWLADIDPNDLHAASRTSEVIGPVSPVAFATEVAVLVDDPRPEMGTEEAERRLLLVFMAAAIISEQLRALKGAKIEHTDLAALNAAIGKLTASDVVSRVNEILEGDDDVLDDDTKEVFVRVFGGGSIIDGEDRPLLPEGVQEALKLPGEDDPDAAMARA